MRVIILIFQSLKRKEIEILPIVEIEMSEILERKRRNISEPLVGKCYSEIQNSKLQSEVHTAEADAYRPSAPATNLITTSDLPVNTHLPLAVKPLRQYQLKSNSTINSDEYRFSNNSSTVSSSSSPSSSSKTLCKTLSGDFRHNSRNIFDDTAKAKSLPASSSTNSSINNSSNISMMKFTPAINSTSILNNAASCVARPIYCDKEMIRDSRDSSDSCNSRDVAKMKATTTLRRFTDTAPRKAKTLSSSTGGTVSAVPFAAPNSSVDIKWEIAKCDIKNETIPRTITTTAATIRPTTKSVLKVIRPRRMTVACSTLNDWPTDSLTSAQKNLSGNDSLKRRTVRELPRKPWFSSSVDGPPVVRETGIDDDLASKRLISTRRFSTINDSATVSVQKPTVLRSSSPHLFRMNFTPPPKPTRTYQETLTGLLQTKNSEQMSSATVKSVRKACPIMGSSRLAAPNNCRNSSDHNSDSRTGTDFRKGSVDTVEISPDIRMSGKWRSSINLPCDAFNLADEDLIIAENPIVRRRNSLVVRTQTGLRVKTIIDKLLNSNGRDQRRALFSLKQIFQDDKDLVHEFVQDGGLECMIKLGRKADQNHQNYILRALGQVMLYVDGMNGIIAHIETIQWLYELLDSPYRLVVKTALKLLLVFIEYTDHNALLLMTAVTNVDKANNRPDWFALMKVLNEKDANDVEMLTYGMTVINKTLNGVADQDTYYDLVDSLESQGLEDAMRHMLKLGHKDLKDQCKLYEKVLKQEDEAESSDESIVKMRIQTPPVADRRIAMRRRHQESLARQQEHYNFHKINSVNNNIEKFESPISNPTTGIINGTTNNVADNAPKVIPPWRKKVADADSSSKNDNAKIAVKEKSLQYSSNGKESVTNQQPSLAPVKSVEKELESNENVEPEEKPVRAPPPSFPATLFSPTENKTMEFPEPIKKEPEPVVESKKISSPKTKAKNSLISVIDDEDDAACGGNAFAAQLRRRALKREQNAALFEPKQDEAEILWKKAAENFKSKPLIINDLDFSEFHKDEYEQDPLVMARLAAIAQEKGLIPGVASSGIPPAPERGPPPAPPLLPSGGAPGVPPPPPFLAPNGSSSQSGRDPSPVSKTGTLKLHWKPAQAELPPVPSLKNMGTFWHKLDLPKIDAKKLVQLFEQKTKETTTIKRLNGEHRVQILQVLPLKRSQAINIGLTKLPPISVIPTAIMKFDSMVLNKEGIEKILTTMMPNPAEIEQIELKIAEHPDMPLGQAEQFLLKLSQIPCLLERLRLWVFTLDYKNCEKDIAEPLMDLQLAMKEVEESKTFRTAMGMLLIIGNTLNGTNIKGFQLDYLTKASEVKDPVYKHTLTYHLAEYMIEHYPDGTDLYSEFGAVARTARYDYDELEANLKKLESDCKASWGYLAKISKNDSSSSMKQKINDYLNDVAQRIHQLKAIYRIACNRWHAFLLFFGYSVHEVPTLKPMAVFKMVNEFALEYRTTRDKILQQRKRLADKRERNKTRGKIWALEGQNCKDGVEINGNLKHTPVQTNAEQRHEAMSRMLSVGSSDDTLKRTRAKPTAERSPAEIISSQREMLRSVGRLAESGSPGRESPDDEILDGLVKAATIQTEPRDHRRRARQFNRKSLRRTRTLKLVDDQPGSTVTTV
uniref:Formin-like protein n=1 Tax=Setaria digitata TaxID=48799 RepID=A0A915PR53_9BILA